LFDGFDGLMGGDRTDRLNQTTHIRIMPLYHNQKEITFFHYIFSFLCKYLLSLDKLMISGLYVLH